MNPTEPETDPSTEGQPVIADEPETEPSGDNYELPELEIPILDFEPQTESQPGQESFGEQETTTPGFGSDMILLPEL